MLSRSLVRVGRVRPHHPIRIRSVSSGTPPSKTNAPLQRSWLTQRIKSNPVLHTIFLGLARALGYGSPQQLANRRALHLYNHLCATRADENPDFWKNGTFLHHSHSCIMTTISSQSVPSLQRSSPGLPSPTYMSGFLLSVCVHFPLRMGRTIFKV